MGIHGHQYHPSSNADYYADPDQHNATAAPSTATMTPADLPATLITAKRRKPERASPVHPARATVRGTWAEAWLRHLDALGPLSPSYLGRRARVHCLAPQWMGCPS